MIKKRKKSYAVVTGASSGIGMEFARRLVAEGYNIILSGRRSDRLNQLSDELKVTGADIIVIEADLSRGELHTGLVLWVPVRGPAG